MTRAFIAALPFALGCAADAGHGFATIETASFEARFEPGPARSLDGALLTDQGYRVALDELALEVESVGFDALVASGGGGSFDPARPPPGYTLCHGGHCHAEDGRLVAYAEVEAELAGGGAGFSRIVTLGAHFTFDLLDPLRRSLSDADPSSELPRTNLRRVVVRARRVEARGTADAEALAAPRELDLALSGPFELSSAFELVIGDEGLGPIELDVALVAGGTLFDGVDFASSSDEELRTTTVDGALGSAVLGALSRSRISVKVTRR